MTRINSRKENELRPVKITTNFVDFAEGSVLIECGRTKVLCCASVEDGAPRHVPEGSGWVTAEYSMLPRANRERSRRDVSKLKLSPRSAEIQRLIGRSLRAAEVRHSPQASCADTPPGCGRKRLLRRRTLPGSASASCAGKSQAPLTPSVGSAAPVSAGRIPRISSCGRRARGGATACRRRCRRPPPRERRSECSGSWPWSPP